MKLRYHLNDLGTEVIKVDTGEVVHRASSKATLERWITRNQQVYGVQFTSEQTALVDQSCFGQPQPLIANAWHSCDAIDYLRFVQTRSNAEIVEVSSKRNTLWRGKNVAFNKARTAFYEVLCEPRLLSVNIEGGLCAFEAVRTGFAPKMLCVKLLLSADDRDELLNVWRHGKAEWYREHAYLPLRGRAETSKQIAIRTPS